MKWVVMLSLLVGTSGAPVALAAGLGSEQAFVPERIDDSKIISLAATVERRCAVNASGQLFCWGAGIAPPDTRQAPGDASSPLVHHHIRDAVAVELLDHEVCVARRSGSTFCFTPWQAAQSELRAGAPVEQLERLGRGVCGRTRSGSVVCGEGGRARPVQGISDAKGLSCAANACCAVRAEGAMACWGAADVSVGLRGGWSASPPRQEGVPPSVRWVSLREGSACAGLPNGGIRCWGIPLKLAEQRELEFASVARVWLSPDSLALQDRSGEVRLYANKSLQTRVAGPVSHFAGETEFGCIARGSQIECWGPNDRGQLGAGGKLSSPTPVAVRSLSGIRSLWGSDRGTCARERSGRIHCWGGGVSAPRDTEVDGDVVVRSRRELFAVVDADGRAFRTAKLDEEGTWRSARWARVRRGWESAFVAGAIDGQGWGCGVDGSGQLACTSASAQKGPRKGGGGFRRVGPVSGVREVAPLDRGLCALLRGGAVQCGTASGFRSVKVPEGSKQLETGRDFGCVRTRRGRVHCWGTGGAPSPFGGEGGEVAELRGATDIATGTGHLCGVIDGGVRCSGSNERGQLGARPSRRRAQWTDVRLPRPAVELAAGALHTCARTTKGTVYCWGSDDEGQLGQGRILRAKAPQRVMH